MTVITRPAQANGSFFGSAEYYPPDAIFALTEAYHKDPSPNKVNLGQGAYRDEHGLPQVLPCVEEALDALDEKGLDHEYLPILGLTGFRERVAELVIGKDIFKSKKDRVNDRMINNPHFFLHSNNQPGGKLSNALWHRLASSARQANCPLSLIEAKDLDTPANMVQSYPYLCIARF